MKLLKNLKLIKIFALVAIFTVFACSSDDDVPTLNITDLTVTVDENQSENTELGTIIASGTDSVFTYSITNQSPAGAIAIDASTGIISVADASSFDFETNPSITATISVVGNSITETSTATISLNDLDDLEFLLSDSKAAYTAAADGDWVIITEAEYNNLADNLNEIVKSGSTDTEYNATSSSQSAVGPYTRANYTTTATIPNNGYVIAFKYKAVNASNVEGFKVKQSSTANNNGFSDLGNALPSHSGSSESIYFVLKGNDAAVTAEGYLAMFQPAGYSINLIDVSDNNGAYYGGGDISSTTNGQWTAWLAAYQGLSTTQKQW